MAGDGILTQSRITSFFKPCKGPLKFDSKPLPKRIAKPKKRRARKKKVVVESDDSDVEIIENTVDTVKEEPLSPKIIFEDDIQYSDFMADDFVTSSQRTQEVSVKMEGSPSKKRKPNNTENNATLMNITITKSTKQVKESHKPSRTLLINTSKETTITYSLQRSEIANNMTIVPDLRQFIDSGIDCDASSFSNESEIIDSNVITQTIKKSIELVKEILQNFMRPHNERLLFEEEKNILVSFCSLESLHQFVCCKLFTHQIKWHNAKVFTDNLHISLGPEKVKEVVKELAEKSLIVTDYRSENLETLLNLLKLDDVKAMYKSLRVTPKATKKEKCIENILKHVNKQPTLNPLKSMDTVVKNMACEELGDMIKISPILYKAFYKVHLLYSFTNSDLQIPSGVYRFMGQVRYESPLPAYVIQDDVVFESPEEFDDYYRAFSYREEMVQEFDKKRQSNMKKLCDIIHREFRHILERDENDTTKPGFLNRFTAGRIYASALTFGVENLSPTYPHEAKAWIETLLSQSRFAVRKRSPLYAKLAIICKKTEVDGESKACDVLIRGLKDNALLRSDVCELVYRAQRYMQKRQFQERFESVEHLFKEVPLAERFPTITISALSQNANEPVYKYHNASGETEYLRVENLAIKHYVDHKGFHEGLHCEGQLVSSLFYLHFWDIIFGESVACTFVAPLQREPLDFFGPHFYENRKEVIHQRLDDIAGGWSNRKYFAYLSSVWLSVNNCRHHISALIVDEAFLFNIVSVLTRTVLAGIFRRLAVHYDECHAGLPDLFLWNDSKCKFVEVKGPGDKLSTKQKLWIEYLLEIGADAEVCYVRRNGSRK